MESMKTQTLSSVGFSFNLCIFYTTTMLFLIFSKHFTECVTFFCLAPIVPLGMPEFNTFFFAFEGVTV